MLGAAYAAWLSQNEPSDRVRSSLVLGVLAVQAERAGRSVPTTLRLHALAAGAPPWPLAPSAEALVESFDSALDAGGGLVDRRLASAQVLGEVLDVLNGVESTGRRSGEEAERRRSGSYFTPRAVARSLVDESLATQLLTALRESGSVRICDPAMGGGAFLLEAVAGLVRRAQLQVPGAEEEALRSAGGSVFGCDQSPLAVGTAEAALWLLTDRTDWQERLVCGDGLQRGVLEAATGFDWLIGNPPWVAFQGRATQKLAPERRAWLKRTYSSFAGYPTLHGVFAERATELAPRGLVSLLLPSSLSDLDGYRASRIAVVRTHEPHEPLLEYGQDAFSGVVQPCFGLVASPRSCPAGAASDAPAGPGESATDGDPGRPWRLRERSRQGASVLELRIPKAVERLRALPKLPATCFGELGLQSNRRVTTELFMRAAEPREPFVVPLLEGRNVRAFAIDPPRLFMNPDPRVLAESRCRYRPLADYQRVDFVVRQTASVTIAARHVGLRFRNSLLAGYAEGEFDADLLIGLLNSSLFRAFHASHQRDARQAAFPQVKVAHLRRLPAPPASSVPREHVRAVSAALSACGPSKDGFASLDQAVFELFEVPPAEQDEVGHYLATRFRSFGRSG